MDRMGRVVMTRLGTRRKAHQHNRRAGKNAREEVEAAAENSLIRHRSFTPPVAVHLHQARV
jgi:hypothetical protein